jgi:DNA-binding MarR family transcriptional regulator
MKPRICATKVVPGHHRVFLSARDCADTPSDSLDFVIAESIAHIVVVTARLFDRQLAMRLRRHDVPIGQWPFLLFLWANENLSQRDLSRLMAIEESTVTATIDRMERDGLISRTRPPANRRRNQLQLTERGRGARHVENGDRLSDDLAQQGAVEPRRRACPSPRYRATRRTRRRDRRRARYRQPSQH